MYSGVLTNVGLMLFYMMTAYVLCKAGKGIAVHAKTMSGFLLYVLSPGMIIHSFLQTEYSPETAGNILKFFLTTLALQVLFFLVLYGVLRRKYAEPKYRILTLGAVLGNVGFLGQPLIYGIFPDHPIVTCYSSVYVMSMNILVFTMGVFLITNDRKYISIKSALLNPTSVSIYVALPLFLFRIKLPAVADHVISLFASMVTPFCMFVLGMRLSTVGWKDLLSRPFVYAACALKLLVFPVFAYLCVVFLPFFDNVFKVSILVLSSMPAGAIIASLAEMHECEQELSANVVLLTTILSVVTIPMILLLAV